MELSRFYHSNRTASWPHGGWYVRNAHRRPPFDAVLDSFADLLRACDAPRTTHQIPAVKHAYCSAPLMLIWGAVAISAASCLSLLGAATVVVSSRFLNAVYVFLGEVNA